VETKPNLLQGLGPNLSIRIGLGVKSCPRCFSGYMAPDHGIDIHCLQCGFVANLVGVIDDRQKSHRGLLSGYSP